jgi:hypothetical protein
MVGGKAIERCGASASRIGRFEADPRFRVRDAGGRERAASKAQASDSKRVT